MNPSEIPNGTHAGNRRIYQDSMQRLISSRKLPALVGVAFLALAVGFGLKALRGPTPAPPTSVQSVASEEPSGAAPAANCAADHSEPVQSVAAQPRIEPSPYTRQLVAGLTNLDLSQGPLTPEQAEQWKKTFQALVAQGAEAVPAICEFIEQNQEVDFGAIGGIGLLGQTSMRSALINALGQIGGPEATGALLGMLQSTPLPSEIAQLGQVLDQQAPGEHRQETINAVNEVLNMASSGELPADWDVAALFKVLQNYGDSATASALEQLQEPYKYYATMSLAGLQGGQGVPVLVREAQDAAGGSKVDFAYQMLAQVAAQAPDASAVLIQQAKANQISDSAWAKIETGLAGDQYQIGAPPSTGGVGPDAEPGLKTYHIASGNQNFYSLPLTGDAQIQQHLALIEQLLGVTSNPAAVTALQSARVSLSAGPPK